MGRRNQLAIPRNVSVWEPLNLPGCVAYWPFDEPRPIDAARDIVGGYNLTQVGNPAVATDRTGTRGARQGFAAGNGNGAGFIRSVAASGTPVIAQGASFSFCFWLYFQTSLNASGTSSTAFMLSLTNTTDANGQIRFSAGSPGTGWTNLNSRLYHTDSTFTTVWIGINNAPTNALTALPNNQWSHWVWLYDAAAHQVRVYRDGTLINTVAATAGKTSSGIGGGLGTGGGNWQIPGLVDDVALFNRVLTADEITLLATTNRPIAGLANPVSSPLDIPNCAIWLDGADTSTMYTSDAGAVTPVTAPTDITGCVGWWDFSDISTLSQDSAGATPVTASGQTIGRIADKSGAGPAITQTTASARPIYQTNLVNGRAAGLFDGIDDALTTTSRTPDNTLTMFGVFVPAPNMAAGASPFNFGPQSGPYFPSGGASSLWWYARSDGLYLQSSVLITSSFPNIVSFTNNANSVVLYKDGVTVTSGAAFSEVSTSNRLNIATRGSSGTAFMPGHCCEFIIFNSVLSAADRARVEKYLAAKWRVPGVHATVGQTGDPVRYWVDKSGGGRHFTSPSSPPRFQATAINGRPAVEFSNSNLRCTGRSDAITQETVFMAMSVTNTANFSRFFTQTSAAGNDFAVSGHWIPLLRSGTTANLCSYADSNGRATVPLTNAAPAIVTSTHTGTAITNTVNGVASSPYTHTLSQTIDRYGIFEDITIGNAYSSGRVMETIVYHRALTTGERARVIRYLQNKWGVGLIPPVAAHPDAQDWVNRVYLNGGTCSQNTVDAVSSFCREIDAAGLRSKFYRLNLFCGNELLACRTPLYRGPSVHERHGFDLDVLTVGSGGSAGNIFTNADYTEYGVSGGLAGRLQSLASAHAGPGLRTGLVPALIPAFYGPKRPNGPSYNYSSLHLATYIRKLRGQTLGTGALIGAYNGFGTGAAEARHGMTFSVNQPSWYIGPFSASVGGAYDNVDRGLYLADVRVTNELVAGDYVNDLTLYAGAMRYATGRTTLGPFLHPNTDFGIFGELRTSIAYNQNDNSLFRAEQTMQGYSIGLGMTEAEVQVYSQIMTRFQNRLGRGLPENTMPAFETISNADARDWLTRVYAAGGAVSVSTAEAVQTFCNAITSANIRDRFYRLNLFCGNNLEACVVPLYRGPTRTGTQYGGLTDRNYNFLASDYSERGLTGGLQGNGSSKYIDTTLGTDWASSSSFSMSAYVTVADTTAFRAVIRASQTTNANSTGIHYQASGMRSTDSVAQLYQNAPEGLSSAGLHGHTRISETDSRQFFNGTVATGTNGGSWPAPAARGTRAVTLFVYNNAGTLNNYSTNRITAYHLGLGMTAQQIADFNSAMQTFQAALLRDRASADPVFASITNADAQLWIDNVYANGGTVSLATATAVNTFCDAIDAAGIRDRFYRLNLVCGNSLAAALVPLYRGQSAAGTKFGNETDITTGFTAAQYAETGTTGGLSTDGGRYLDIGTITSMDAASQHVSNYVRLRSGQTSVGGFGVNIGGTGWETRIQYRGALTGRVWIGAQFWGGDFTPTSTVTQTTFVLGSRTSASNMFTQFNGVANGSDAVARTIPAASAASVTVCSQATGSYLDGIMAGYSFGLGMTTTQAQDFYNAMQTFQTALGRNV